ncbi:hypothetical protein E0H86_07290 [Acinetobacter sp. ANC 4635]|uniref:hypothetical protein n=1 Tax=Acinetobacter sp. ANC 4635 TaxID=2529846 RepID=UPI00103ADF6A|nr:hypothetical protein [Acinetobacter sp. ANC 4635]TCB32211.1 hypothetical protein E0H86_07290 [Acinetobacter sp. ANC 4635]
MGVDELREAIEKGYLGSKLDAKKTFNMTHEMLDAMYVASESDGVDVQEWFRSTIAKALLVVDYNYERSTRARQRAKAFMDTLGHHKKENSVVGATESFVQLTSEENEQ